MWCNITVERSNPMEGVYARRIPTSEAANILIKQPGEVITEPFEDIDFHIYLNGAGGTVLYDESGIGRSMYRPSLLSEDYATYARRSHEAKDAYVYDDKYREEDAYEKALKLCNIKTAFDMALSSDTDSMSRNLQFIRQFIDWYNQSESNVPIVRGDMEVNDIADAIDSYKQYYGEHIVDSNIDIIANEARTQMISAAKSRRARYLFGPGISSITGALETTPLVVADPLTVISEWLRWESDGLEGYYNPHSRLASIDYLAAVNSLALDTDGSPAEPALQKEVISTVMHELVHSATSTRYKTELPARSIDKQHYSDIKATNLVPQFLGEGMTEKIACSLNLIATLERDGNYSVFESLDFPHQATFQYEDYQRSRFDRPKEVVSHQDVAEARTRIFSEYPDERLLIDLLFSKINWESQGITQRQAEHKLVSTFLDSYDDEIAKSANRKDFNATVAKAAHPGIMNKLDTLIKVAGRDAVITRLSEPDLDLSDPESIPFIASRRDQEYFEIMRRREELPESARMRYKQSYRIQELKEGDAARIAKLEATIKYELPEYIVITRGLMADLKKDKLKTELMKKDIYNIRSYTWTPENRLRLAIFGMKDSLAKEVVLDTLTEQEKEDLKAYEAWKEAGRLRIRGNRN